jgi:hypothetical protein
VSSGSPRSRRKPRLPVVAGWLLRLAVVALAFALGLAVGQAIEDRPPEGEPVTNISTIRPWTQTTQP